MPEHKRAHKQDENRVTTPSVPHPMPERTFKRADVKGPLPSKGLVLRSATLRLQLWSLGGFTGFSSTLRCENPGVPVDTSLNLVLSLPSSPCRLVSRPI